METLKRKGIKYVIVETSNPYTEKVLIYIY